MEITRTTLADLVAMGAGSQEPLVAQIRKDPVGGDYLQVGETSVRVMDPEVPGKTAQEWLRSSVNRAGSTDGGTRSRQPLGATIPGHSEACGVDRLDADRIRTGTNLGEVGEGPSETDRIHRWTENGWTPTCRAKVAWLRLAPRNSRTKTSISA